MKRYPFLTGKETGLGYALLVWTMIGAAPLSAVGAERVVLGEEFSATW